MIKLSAIANERDSFSNIPLKYDLHQNYPNPFNPITTITYDIIKLQNVEVTIYDILGREIKSLVNDQQQPGSYTIKWDASNVSSGVYFYQLKTKDYINTKKMILLK
ncbi:T9SS type A sorting domain-containing protein [Ignavibacterium sp.]|uniref:T9SS type A sorting domain-containing protein n=1 Tax=Ignavibacterium sp. TaxID=2651167 RepID=UPI00307D43A3